MRNAVIASAAMMATSAFAQGTAHVINSCSYDVHLSNTPAQGGGFEPIDRVLSASGGSYSQQWTQLGNDMGWSIKLAKTDSYQTNLMQYEYTFHNDGIIWYDLSEVDGNPWNGNWMITASSGCDPKQQAYRYSTDDAYGMQSCPSDASITVTLCSGDSSGGAESSDSGDSTTIAATPTSAPSTTQAPTPSTTKTKTKGHNTWTNTWTYGGNGGVKKAAEITASPTTLVTKAVSVSDAGDYDVTVTDWQTAVVTAYVTAGHPKRHEHHPRHPHQKREE